MVCQKSICRTPCLYSNTVFTQASVGSDNVISTINPQIITNICFRWANWSAFWLQLKANFVGPLSANPCICRIPSPVKQVLWHSWSYYQLHATFLFFISTSLCNQLLLKEPEVAVAKCPDFAFPWGTGVRVAPVLNWLLCHALSLLGLTPFLLPGELQGDEVALPTFLTWISVY